MKVKTTTVDVFGFLVIYIHDCEFKKYCEFIEKHFGETIEDEYCRAICVFIEEAKTIVMWFNDFNNAGEIVHESLHAANFIFDYIGYEVRPDNDEVAAYLTEWIFRQAVS